MDERNRQIEQPLWVKAGLYGLPNRISVWAFVWLSLIIAAGCVAYGLVDSRFFFGGIVAFAALWYYSCIRWVDRHGGW